MIAATLLLATLASAQVTVVTVLDADGLPIKDAVVLTSRTGKFDEKATKKFTADQEGQVELDFLQDYKRVYIVASKVADSKKVMYSTVATLRKGDDDDWPPAAVDLRIGALVRNTSPQVRQRQLAVATVEELWVNECSAVWDPCRGAYVPTGRMRPIYITRDPCCCAP